MAHPKQVQRQQTREHRGSDGVVLIWCLKAFWWRTFTVCFQETTEEKFFVRWCVFVYILLGMKFICMLIYRRTSLIVKFVVLGCMWRYRPVNLPPASYFVFMVFIIAQFGLIRFGFHVLLFHGGQCFLLCVCLALRFNCCSDNQSSGLGIPDGAEPSLLPERYLCCGSRGCRCR